MEACLALLSSGTCPTLPGTFTHHGLLMRAELVFFIVLHRPGLTTGMHLGPGPGVWNFFVPGSGL